MQRFECINNPSRDSMDIEASNHLKEVIMPSKFKVVVMIVERGSNFSASSRVYKEIPARDKNEAFDIAIENTFNMKGGSFLKAYIMEN